MASHEGSGSASVMRVAALGITALGGALSQKQHAMTPKTGAAFVIPLTAATARAAIHGERGVDIVASSSSSNTRRTGRGVVASRGGGGRPSCEDHSDTGVTLARTRRKREDACFLVNTAKVGVSTLSPKHGAAFAAAAYFRGGTGIDDAGAIAADVGAVGAAAAAEGLTGGTAPEKKLMLDHVEDTLGTIGRSIRVVGTPILHVGRLGFGLCLLFYGMAFRTFAFHVIVFRIAGFKQVQASISKLAAKYRQARQSIREAAAAAESVKKEQERKAAQAEKLKATHEKMIKEKRQMLANGRKLTKEDTRRFMKKYDKELTVIKEEQAKFNSINSSIVSVKSSVDPKTAKSGLGGLYGAIITSFTASTYQPAGQVALGLHIGTLLKTHLLDLFGPIIDPIGYRLDLTTYYDEAEIPYMGNANAMGGPQNLAMNVFCYALVFAIIRAHPRLALKTAMVYFGARLVTDYIVMATEPVRSKLGLMTAVHTPWSALIHAGLTLLGFCYHREVLHTAGAAGFHPLLVGPGLVGMVEPLVRFAVWVSEVLHKIEFFTITYFTSHPK